MLLRKISFRCLRKNHYSQLAEISERHLTNEIVRNKRNELFETEKKRQSSLIPRLEKITVEFLPLPEQESATLIMNKYESTPYEVARHLNEAILESSALALVNNVLWDMHKPLNEDCRIKFLTFTQEEDPYVVNKAFWRSCSFMLGATIDSIFQDKYFVELHSFPSPNVSSGSFVHDVDLKIKDWKPSKMEMMALSSFMHTLSEKSLPFESLNVDASFALQMFSENRFKKRQIPSICARSHSGNSLTLYRIGSHVDISAGPMIANTNFLGRRCSIMAAHPIETDGEPLLRFQGVALPKGIHLDSFSFGLLEKRATLLNTKSSYGKNIHT